MISDTLLFGVDVGYRGPQVSRSTPNLPSAHQHANVLEKHIATELNSHHTIRPFPLILSRILFRAH